MKVPYSWLKEYVDIDISAKELEEKLLAESINEFLSGLKESERK